jgi:AraC-like DNA-binding protein
LPLSLTGPGSWQLAHHGLPQENKFCALMSQHGSACAACLRFQEKAARRSVPAGSTMECLHGLCETAVPIYAADRSVIGYLRTGQVFHRRPSAGDFKRVLKRLARWGTKLDENKLRSAYFATPVIKPARYHSIVGLLHFLAQHLSILSNQIVLQNSLLEIPAISNAKKFIHTHYTNNLTLRQVAGAVHVDPFSLSRKFKKMTGINFSHYISRLRVEKAKDLLLNPHHRVIEIAFEIGFGSLTHFGRTFRQIVGLNPTEYRARLVSPSNGVTRVPQNDR